MKTEAEQRQIYKKMYERQVLLVSFIDEYKECFYFENTLIIIMDYCESIFYFIKDGDLQTILKNWKKGVILWTKK